jgi:F-type H+-transporting ATPase subunit epsilon
MNVVILTPEKEAFNGAAKSIKVPGTSGEFEVLSNHAPIISSLEQGTVRVLTEGGDKIIFQINSGFEDLVEEEEESEEEYVDPKDLTKQGYKKDGFVVEDGDMEFNSDSEEEE